MQLTVIAFLCMRRICAANLSKAAFWRTLGAEFRRCAETHGQVRAVRDELGRWGVVGATAAGVAEFKRLCIRGVRFGYGVECADEDAVNVWLEMVVQQRNG
jgi:hypothetical protein